MEQRNRRKGPQEKGGRPQKIQIPKSRLQRLIEKVQQDQKWRLTSIAVLVIGASLIMRFCTESTPPPLSVATTTVAVATSDPPPPQKQEEDGGASESRVDESMPAETQTPPPLIKSIRLDPSAAFAGNRLRVQVETDQAEEETVELTYQWLRNGQAIVDATSETLDTTDFARGDQVAVAVFLADGEEGNSLASAAIILGNHPPVIHSTPAASLHDGQYIYAVKATDADNDPLTYSLENAPGGMSIDSSGLISWTVPDNIEGLVTATIIVSDGESRALQVLQLTFAQSGDR